LRLPALCVHYLRSKVDEGGYTVRPEDELLRIVEALVRTATSLKTHVPQRLHAVKVLLGIAQRQLRNVANDAHIVEAAVGLNRALPFLEEIATSQQYPLQRRSRRYSEQTRSRAEALAAAIRGKRPPADEGHYPALEKSVTAPAQGSSRSRITTEPNRTFPFTRAR
jgi:hypothetical protein